jgi:hypothetical protein
MAIWPLKGRAGAEGRNRTGTGLAAQGFIGLRNALAQKAVLDEQFADFFR